MSWTIIFWYSLKQKSERSSTHKFHAEKTTAGSFVGGNDKRKRNVRRHVTLNQISCFSHRITRNRKSKIKENQLNLPPWHWNKPLLFCETNDVITSSNLIILLSLLSPCCFRFISFLFSSFIFALARAAKKIWWKFEFYSHHRSESVEKCLVDGGKSYGIHLWKLRDNAGWRKKFFVCEFPGLEDGSTRCLSVSIRFINFFSS